MKISLSFGVSFFLFRFWSSQSFITNQYTSRAARNNHALNIAISREAAYGKLGEDVVWDSMRKDAAIEASREPLLASFMHATILSHSSLERAMAFHIANLLSSPAMISTQIQALILEVKSADFLTSFNIIINVTKQTPHNNTAFIFQFIDQSPEFKISLRMDILAVMDRDPAVRTSPDVILYFKGFQALQTHRVAHWLWTSGLYNISIPYYVYTIFILQYIYTTSMIYCTMSIP
jgi:hypothetical protein